MDNPVLAVFGIILFLAALKVLVPLAVQLVDGILLAVIRAPLRWLAQRIKSRSQLSPYQRSLRRASEGAFLFVASVYAASWFPVFLGRSLGEMTQRLVLAPTDYPGVIVFFAVAALSFIWVVTGMRGARGGDRDWMIAFWSAAIATACIAALWWQWLPPWPGRTYGTLLMIAGVKGFYIATAAAFACLLVHVDAIGRMSEPAQAPAGDSRCRLGAPPVLQ